MGTIRVIIRISDKDFKIIKHNVAVHKPLCPMGQEKMVQMIANGIPLPKNSIFVERRVGKWLWKPTGYSHIDGSIGVWFCSVCKNVIDENVPMNYIGHVLPYNYCPICGAKTERLEFESKCN